LELRHIIEINRELMKAHKKLVSAVAGDKTYGKKKPKRG
jgi:hypothetical protein